MNDKISDTLYWLKTNPVTVVCALVILLALASFYWPTYRWSSQLQEEMSASASLRGRVDSFLSQSVELPPVSPEAEPEEASFAINSAAVEELDRLYGQMGQEYDNIFQQVVDFNRQGHEVMLEGLFPEPDAESPSAKLFGAKKVYIERFRQLYEALDATAAPSEQEWQEVLRTAEQNFRQNTFSSSDQNLTPRQEKELVEDQARKLSRFFAEHAQRHHVYAPPIRVDINNADTWNGGPFQIGEWAQARSDKPSMFQVWEGQLQLWIQQDLVEVVRLANQVDNPDVSILTAPVKRIMSMSVKPGYVGVPSSGLGQESGTSSSGSPASAINEPLPVDFASSPTGRISNPLYDVRHAEMELIVDSQQIPALLDAFNRVNFMSVIGMDMENIDEYQHLRNGYFYGEADAVQVTLDIETIWLRTWTAGDPPEEAESEDFDPGLMPDMVRHYLGLPTRDEDFAVPEEMLREGGYGFSELQ